MLSCRQFLLCILLLSSAVLMSLGLLLIGAELWTMLSAANHCHKTPEACRGGDVAVVLGCSKYLRRSCENPYFRGRMEAAAALWNSGKLRGIIVSGDNREKYYNEPLVMNRELVALGVPGDRIIRDYAGFRTLDSVVRAQKVFGAKKILFISQPDHVERAVALARKLGMDAEGYEAPLTRAGRASRCHQWLRERAARVVMLVDYLFGRSPHFLGDPITLPF